LIVLAGGALALAAAPVRAEPPPPPSPLPPKHGTLTLTGGFRSLWQHTFLAQQKSDGLNPEHPLLHPHGWFSAGYRIDELLHVSLDFGYGIETTHLTGGDSQARTFNILIALDGAVFERSWISAYVGAGLGYSLNTFERGAPIESNSSAGMVKAGARFRLNDLFSLVVENRFVLSSAAWPQQNSNVNVGGYTLTAGVMVHWFTGETRRMGGGD
jgi:opacity protein-like surface antigen